MRVERRDVVVRLSEEGRRSIVPRRRVKAKMEKDCRGEGELVW